MLFRGKYIDAGGFLQPLRWALSYLWPDMAKLLRVELEQPDATNFFCNIIKSQLESRKKSGNRRIDFIDALLKVKLSLG